MTETFTEIYKNRTWGEKSGDGSKEENTIIYRTFLQKFLNQNRIRSVCDLGCGYWQVGSLIDWTGIDYYGIDCVKHVIEELKSRERENIHFECIDLILDYKKIPNCDLYILKDVLQHWPNENIINILTFLKGKSVLITNDYHSSSHIYDTKLGGCRPLNKDVYPLSKFNLDYLWDEKGKRTYLMK